MSFFSKLFGRPEAKSVNSDHSGRETDPLVPVPIPALGVLLLNLEKEKGSPLSQSEVEEIRDKAACMMLPLSAKRAMEEKRGYSDVNPENVWPEWLAFRAEALRDAP